MLAQIIAPNAQLLLQLVQLQFAYSANWDGVSMIPTVLASNAHQIVIIVIQMVSVHNVDQELGLGTQPPQLLYYQQQVIPIAITHTL